MNYQFHDEGSTRYHQWSEGEFSEDPYENIVIEENLVMVDPAYRWYVRVDRSEYLGTRDEVVAKLNEWLPTEGYAEIDFPAD